jgi:hypothetical protein
MKQQLVVSLVDLDIRSMLQHVDHAIHISDFSLMLMEFAKKYVEMACIWVRPNVMMVT